MLLGTERMAYEAARQRTGANSERSVPAQKVAGAILPVLLSRVIPSHRCSMAKMAAAMRSCLAITGLNRVPFLLGNLFSIDSPQLRKEL
jgi:hypothetical protein